MNKNKRRNIVILVLLVMILLPLTYFAFSYNRNPFDAEFTEILYESPPGGEVVNLNAWYFGEVLVEYPRPGLRNSFSFEFEIVDWQECPEPLEFWQGLKPMTYNEFLEMNATERALLFSTAELNIARDHTPGTSASTIDTIGPHVWCTRFVYQDDPSVSGTFKVQIKIHLLQIEE